MIPRIIHYCWFGGKLPKRNKELIDQWKILMPDYIFYLWTDADIINISNKFLKQAYKKKQYAFVSDYIRILKVIEFGGFYLDTDMYLVRDLNELTNFKFIICSEVENRPNWSFFGAEKGNTLLQKCLDKYQDIEFDQFKPPVIPFFLRNITLQYIDLNPMDTYNLDPEFFYPMPLLKKNIDFIKFKTDKTIGIHLWDFTWFDLKKDRPLFIEITYRIKILIFDFLSFSYSLYYFRINFIRIIRLIFQKKKI